MVDGVDLTVALAETPDQQSQGLAGIATLPGDIEGMLFVYTEPKRATFNMRTVRFPLDIWWFDGDAQLIAKTEMKTCLEGDCSLYPSPGEIMWALETPAGLFQFSPGSNLRIRTVETG